MEKEKYMLMALKEAQKAYNKNEVPIGAVIVKDDKIISRAHNLKESNHLVTSHAEILAINKACKKLKNWRLIDCDIYVTMEPCIMCAGALMQSRIKNIYYGMPDNRFGGIISKIKTFETEGLDSYPNVKGGILEKECVEIIQKFFQQRRKEK
ncbi:MAG: nucleoside deaminase [Erysipelotrichaceae bacterium]